MGIDPEKVKKAKKNKGEKKEGGKERKKTPWKAKQTMRVERCIKTLSKLSGVLGAAKAPNIDPTLANNALSAVSTLKAQVDMLPGDWKPAKGSSPGTSKKAGIGSRVQVKDGLEGDDLKVYAHMPVTLFLNSEIIGDDGRYWVVKCTDNGVVRLLRKKHTALYVAPAAPATAAA